MFDLFDGPSRLRRLVAGCAVMAAVVLLWPAGAHALPDQLLQEGLVLDDGDLPLQGEHRIRVRLYAQGEGGEALFDEVHPAVPFINGYYAVAIGSVERLDGALFQRESRRSPRGRCAGCSPSRPLARRPAAW